MVLLSLLKVCFLTHWTCCLLKCLFKLDFSGQTKICLCPISLRYARKWKYKLLHTGTSLHLIVYLLSFKPLCLEAQAAFWNCQKWLWYLHGSLLGDLNFQVLVQSIIVVDIKTWREQRCGALFKGIASYTDQLQGFVYCRGEKMAVAAKWFEVIGMTPIRENVSFLTFRSTAWHWGGRVTLNKAA